MASTTSPTLPFTKPESLFLCFRGDIGSRKSGCWSSSNGSIIVSSPIISFTRIHSSKPEPISGKFRKVSSFKPNGSSVYSFSKAYSSANDKIDVKEAAYKDTTDEPVIHVSSWNWKGYSIRYQHSGDSGPALVLVHGFGANSDHWRKNLPVLAKSHKVYSIDLIGYGYSDKPNPHEFGKSPFYTFETWATQLNEFCVDVVKDEAFFICNSIGGLVGLQAAVSEPQLCKGIVLLNISLRMLHIKKQPWFGRPFIRSFQNLLRNTTLGKFFFNSIATTEAVRSILCQCYHDTSQVTPELVEKILLPGLEPGAADVFLEFICYSGGPLPEELLPKMKCPVLIAWGDKDPWEPIELGRIYGGFDCVEEFIVLPDVGHCPQDEAPHLVNPLVESFVSRHYMSKSTLSSVN